MNKECVNCENLEECAKKNVHHYGHEFTGIDIAKDFIKENRFDAYTNEFILVGVRNHMKAHFINKMKPIKIVRFVKCIPKHMVEDFKSLVFADHPLNVEEVENFSNIFTFINNYRLTEDEVAIVTKSKDKRNSFEQILAKRFVQEFKK